MNRFAKTVVATALGVCLVLGNVTVWAADQPKNWTPPAQKIYAQKLSDETMAKHPELLEQFREGMLVPRRDQIAASLERGKERGDVRADLDTRLAAHAVMGSFLFHYLSVGRPQKGWSERVVDTLWPGFAA